MKKIILILALLFAPFVAFAVAPSINQVITPVTQGFVYSDGSNNSKLIASSSPTVNTLYATSTTGTSYFLGKEQVGTTSLSGYNLGVGGNSIFAQYLINTRTSYNIPPTTATRSNFTGSLGYGFTVDQPTLVTELGRLYVAGNTQNHKAYLWNASITSAPLASSTIYASYTSDSDNFKWATITPQRLEPGITYIVAIDETNGGDTWKDGWAQTTSWQPNFNYAYQAYYTGNGGYPNNQTNNGLGYNTVAMKHKVMSTLDVDTTGVDRDGLVVETPLLGYTGGTDFYPLIIKGTVRGSTGTRYMTTMGYQGNAGMHTNAYISINGADQEYPSGVIANDTVFMLGINSDVQPNPAFVIRSSSGAQIKGVSQTSGISGSGATDVNTWNINYDGGGNFMGKIGIGTTSPYAKLSVAGQIVFDNFFATSTTGTSTIMGALSIGSTTPNATNWFAVGSTTQNLAVNRISGDTTIGSRLLFMKPSNPTETAEIYTDTDQVNSSVRALYITPPVGASSNRIYLGSASKTAYSLNLANVSNLENVPPITSSRYSLPGNITPTFNLMGGGSGQQINMNSYYGIVIRPTWNATPSTSYSALGSLTEYGLVVAGQQPATKQFAIIATTSQTASLFELQDSSRNTLTVFDSAGKLGLGTTSPWKTLSVVGGVSINGLTAAASTADAICLNSTTKEVLVNTGAPTCTVSSAKYKTNIQELQNALSTIELFKPVSFNAIADNSAHIGLIAEEVAKVDERLIFKEVDGSPRGVRYEEITALLIKGMQEQEARIKLLEQEIKNLKK